jgi:hypothetical protein
VEKINKFKENTIYKCIIYNPIKCYKKFLGTNHKILTKRIINKQINQIWIKKNKFLKMKLLIKKRDKRHHYKMK